MTAEVIGKPEEAFFNAALRQLNSMIPSTEIQTPIEKEGKSFAKYFYISRIVALNFGCFNENLILYGIFQKF